MFYLSTTRILHVFNIVIYVMSHAIYVTEKCDLITATICLYLTM